MTEWNRWHITQLTPEAAEAHDRRVHNAPKPIMLGWKPYTYRATRGAVAQWACHDERQLEAKLHRHGLRIVAWTNWHDGMRSTREIKEAV